MGQIWVADTEPNQRFTLYSRGNTGEVFPNVITALTGTLIGDAVRQGQVDVFVEMGFLRPNEVVGPSIGTGVFGGYLYMNGSVVRLSGVRMIGMTTKDTDEQIMGEVSDLPPYRRAKGDRNLMATLLLGRSVTKLLRSPDLTPLERARAEARTWLSTIPRREWRNCIRSGASHRRSGRPPRSRTRGRPRVRHHGSIVDTAVPRRSRGRLRHRCHSEPRSDRRPRARHSRSPERSRHHIDLRWHHLACRR